MVILVKLRYKKDFLLEFEIYIQSLSILSLYYNIFVT